MVEHGKCASGSSKGCGGAYAIGLDAMGFLQIYALLFSAGYRIVPVWLLVSKPANFNSGRVPLGIQIPPAVTSTPTGRRRLPGGSHPPSDLRCIPLWVSCALRAFSTTSSDSAVFLPHIEQLTCQIILSFPTDRKSTRLNSSHVR